MNEQLSDEEVRESLSGLVVGTMCHCDERTDDGEPDEDCYDHWQFFIVDDPESVPEDGHVGRGRTLNEAQMRYLAALATPSTPGAGQPTKELFEVADAAWHHLNESSEYVAGLDAALTALEATGWVPRPQAPATGQGEPS